MADNTQIQNELWRRGDLNFLLRPEQHKILAALAKQSGKIRTVLASRRLGKTFGLLVEGSKICIKKPFAIIKYICPEKGQGVRNLKEDMRDILVTCPPDMLPKWHGGTDSCYRFPNGSEIQVAGTDNKNYNSLRGGCLTGDTLVLTPSGCVRIDEIQQGDTVYGYNADGSVSETTVKIKFDNGIKEVHEMLYKGRVIGSTTDNHKWVINSRTSLQLNKPIDREVEFGDIDLQNSRFNQQYVTIPCGDVSESDAYIIGAYIGDGCKADRGNGFYVAGKDESVFKEIKRLLGCKYNYNSSNYRAYFYDESYVNSKTEKLTFNYYAEWLKGKYFHNKNFDWDVVDSWDRASCLKLLAGLLDTDGNVYYSKEGIELTFNHSNLPLAENIQKLVYKMYRYMPRIKQDSRIEKYTRPHYKIIIRSAHYVKLMLSEMSQFIQCDRKKMKDEYLNIQASDIHPGGKISKGKTYQEHTYDLHVDNETHLYLLADGFVTHNSADMCIVDEAGFCTDLGIVVRSVLRPTILHTPGGCVYLVSTPSESANHEFITEFINPAKDAGKLDVLDIYESSVLTKDDIAEIALDYPGGIDNPEFQREYLCMISESGKTKVIPEATKDRVDELTVKDIKMPAYYDAYVSGDIGFKDLTAYLFGFWDFHRGVLVIIDELIIYGPELKGIALTDALANGIKEKEAMWFHNPATVTRVMDNDLIIIDDLQVAHDLNFQPTAKDNKDGAVNMLRMLINNNQLEIHERCVHLRYHLIAAQWKENTGNMKARSFKHIPNTPDNKIRGGHSDALDSLIYMNRNVMRHKNPFPAGHDIPSGDDVFISALTQDKITRTHETFQTMMGMDPRKMNEKKNKITPQNRWKFKR